MTSFFSEVALQQALECWQRAAPCLGSNVSVMDAEGNHWHGASGYVRPDANERLQPLRMCYVYSITKVFTAIRILQLVGEGELKLDEKVSVYLGELGLPANITLRQLLNHTSGIPDYTTLAEYDPAVRRHPGQPWTFEETLSLCCGKKADFLPGEGWAYSNTGYMLLARLIEIMTGQSYSQAITEQIIEPLGLHNTRVATDIDKGLLTPGYSRNLNDEERLEDITPIYHPGWCQTGLLISTTEDISRLLITLFNDEFINKLHLNEMCEAVSIKRSAGSFYCSPCYGLGLMIDPDWGNAGLYGHSGEGPGFNTWALYIPDKDGYWRVITVFCNTSMVGQPVHLVKDLLRVFRHHLT
ncbi:beta-lactamase family protein [Xenorhabdus sp. DI]|uniref:serine hydrolase domain-containing protein n=1 Tax=Xenorhabdus doucetiae TaxID=351671 RepID=UPI00198963DE|nr:MULTISPECIES: serine hydrolase domain-containing protein [unclassified Xenorhabdus]MBD2784509.1 beta-lactamase family protein [Xenorhabdus sp. 3]MBD2790465.1 beta-lactamase family protein [Xenorhabdus sp. DI]